MKRLIYCILVVFIVFSCQTNINTPKNENKKTNISVPVEFEYLNSILKETFNSILYFRNPDNGAPSKYPYSPQAGELVKVEHMTLMLASIAVAGKIGLISDSLAKTELTKMLTWIEAIPKVSGFPADMVSVIDASQVLDPVTYPIADVGFYPCGIIVAGEAYPELKSRTSTLINSMDWSKLYNTSTGYLYGTYSITKGSNTLSLGGLFPQIAADLRMAIFISIATHGAPADLWTRMPRNYLTHYGISYLKPGEGMGYGEATCAFGYFMDERGTDIGMSNANMTWAQMHYALDMDYPTWGWSNCMYPNTAERDYMGFGDKDTNWSIINPHAIAAAVIYYPNQVAKAFHILESMGVRDLINVNGTNYNFGFRGSVNIDTKQSRSDIIPGLDQTIIFLSLANCLYNGVVWNLFKKNEVVQEGITLIPEYALPNSNYLDIYKDRDNNGPQITHSSNPPQNNAIIVDDFSLTSSINNLGFSRDTVDTNVTYDGTQANIEFTSMDNTNENIGFKENLGGIDLTYFKALKLQIKSDSPGNIMAYLKTSGNSGYRPIYVAPEWHDIIIPIRNFLGGLKPYQWPVENPPIEWLAMWDDRSSAAKVWLGPKDNNVSRIYIKNISFLFLTKDEINNAGGILYHTYVETDGTFERMETTSGWSIGKNGTEIASIHIDSNGYRDNCLTLDNTFDSTGVWVSIGKNYDIVLNASYTIKFWMKATASSSQNLEVKIIDSTGATYLKQLSGVVYTSGWHEITVQSSEITYGWGGTAGTKPDKICKFEFGITSGPANAQIYFDDLKIIQ